MAAVFKYSLLLIVTLGVFAGCDLHGESALRAKLGQYFDIGETLYYESKPACTAAIYRVNKNIPLAGMPMAKSWDDAQDLYYKKAKVALLVKGKSAHQLVEEMLTGENKVFGNKALAAAALVGKCLGATQENAFKRALTRTSAVLAYDAVSNGMMVLDPFERKLFFAAGEVF